MALKICKKAFLAAGFKFRVELFDVIRKLLDVLYPGKLLKVG
jgi:hypothetical protein